MSAHDPTISVALQVRASGYGTVLHPSKFTSSKFMRREPLFELASP